MQKTKIVPLDGGSDVTVKELAIDEIIAVLDAAEAAYEAKAKPHALDMLFPRGIPAEALARSLSTDLAGLGEYTPGEIELLRGAAAELNPIFLKMWENITSVGKEFADIAEVLKENGSKKPSASSLDMATTEPGNTDTASS